MIRSKGIALRLSSSILISTTAIFLFIFGYNYFISRRTIVKKLDDNARTLTLATVNKIESVLLSVQKVPTSLACILENMDSEAEEIERMLEAAVQRNPEIYGVGITYEPYTFSSQIQYYTPYIYRRNDSLHWSKEPDPRDYYEDWYQIPFMLNQPLWSEPYFDQGAGKIVMCTFSVPFYKSTNGERKIAGIVFADIDLSWLQEIVSSIRIAQTGYGFLISKNGTIVTHPEKKLIMNETLFSVAEEMEYPEMRRIGRAMIRGDSGFVPVKSLLTREDCWMSYVPLQSNGWSLGVLFPKRELMADLSMLNQMVLIFGVIGFCILLMVTVVISGTITRPLRMLVRTTEEISRGNMDFVIPQISTDDETGRLAQSFTHMQQALKEHIRELTETTAAKERIESELKIAHDIQTNMLPRIYPPFPERQEIDLFAMIQPAREVGGDFFDFFFIDNSNLFFYIADVAGKGVPASLFMAVTRTLIKTKCTSGLRPEIVMARVNDDLCMDNDACMFVTLFCGLLNVESGRFVYVNAGHNPPLVCRHMGAFEFLDAPKGIALGVMQGITFKSQETILQKSDSVFLYTDGVNEALNPQKELFGTERLIDVLNQVKHCTTREQIQQLYQSIVTFTNGEVQSDDITMLTLMYCGNNHSINGG